MNVLIACEESQRVCMAFRNRGHNAFSCDIQEPSGGYPEFHILGDVLLYINRVFDNVRFLTMDGKLHSIFKWDLIIAHPPCTDLAASGAQWYTKGKKTEADKTKAAAFFMEFVNADCDRICVENPVGFMSTIYRKPDQIIQPWQFGDNYEKTTCLWLKGLQPLVPGISEKPELDYKYYTNKATGRKRRQPMWYYDALNAKTAEERRKIRSKTFPGIAKAMAEQWG